MINSGRGKRAIEIKICGITTPEDAVMAIECGAHGLGFNLYPRSKRFISVDTAGEWIRDLPLSNKVAVMVDPTWDQIINVADSGLFHGIQLHGNESTEICRRLAGTGIFFTKAIAMEDEQSLEQSTDFATSNILLDSRTSEGFGGTGKIFPWSLARRFVEMHPGFRVTIAGGLTPENVGEAINAVRPAGVDVTSGVEARYGRKDRCRLQAFIDAVAAA
jgi:phosphoribosylanthranilate isomerase